MDLKTPRNAQLSGFFKRSNAVMNNLELIPNDLNTIADDLNSKMFEFSSKEVEAMEEMKTAITNILALRDEVIQDTPFRKLYSDTPEAKFYNDYLEKMTCEDCRPTMMKTARIYAECYVYRRVWECFELTKNLKNMDPFESMKMNLFHIALPLIKKTSIYLCNMYKYPSPDDKDDFEKLIKLLLWSNQGNYLMSKEFVMQNYFTILETKKRDPLIACNQVEEAWKVISDRSYRSDVIAFICDNTGYELFMELCIADYLYTKFYARRIHFHVKHIPWFISDTMEKDVHWMLHQLGQIHDKHLQELVNNWKHHFKAGRWKIIHRKYWTLPIGFNRMKDIDPVLYTMLQDTKLVILKGDLNYRKLLEDVNVDPTKSFTEVLGDFYPSNMMTVRVMKCEVACNISAIEFQKFEKLDKQWMIRGKYGLIQFIPRRIESCDCLGN